MWQGAIGVQAAADQAAWQGMRLMIAYLALELTGSVVFVGVVTAIFALSGLLVSVPSGRLSDRFGSARVAFIALSVSILGTAVAVLSPSVPGVVVLAAVVGGSHVFSIVAQQNFVARVATGSPDAAFGTLTAAVSIGQLVGPPLVTAAAVAWAASPTHPNAGIGLLCCIALWAVAVPTYFVLRPAELRAQGPQLPAGKPPSLLTTLRIKGILPSMLVGGAVLVTVDLLASFIPVWAVAQHIPASVVGWLLALRALFTIVSRFGVARMVARFGRKTLLLVALSLGVVALVAMPFADAWWAIPLMALLGLGLGLPQPLTLAWMSSLTPVHSRGAAFGARMTVNRLAQVSLPLIVSVVAGPLGVLAVFLSTAAILAGGVAIVGATHAAALNEHASPDDVERDVDSPDAA